MRGSGHGSLLQMRDNAPFAPHPRRMDVITAFVFVFAMLAIGRALAYWRVVPEAAPDALNQVVLYVCLPASVLLYAPKLELNASVLALMAVPWLLVLASMGLVWMAGRLLRWSPTTIAVLLLALPLSNSSFLGYPLIAALLGEQALPYAVIYDQFGSFIILSTYGLMVLAFYAHGEKPSARGVTLRVLRFPPFLALMVALTLMPRSYPIGVELVLKRLSEAMLPLVTLAIGMQIRLRLPREHIGPLVFGLSAKLLLLPLLAWGLAWIFGAQGDMRAVLVLETAMPTMITSMALAAAAGLAPELAAALIGYGIALAVVTLPVWRWLLTLS
jgi:malate permease and related proteins